METEEINNEVQEARGRLEDDEAFLCIIEVVARALWSRSGKILLKLQTMLEIEQWIITS